MSFSAEAWTDYAEALAFVGNSLLAPMSQTEKAGLEPGFWERFPDFGNAEVAEATRALRDFAEAAERAAAEGGNPVQDASVEFTALFIGPPRPAAAPWETMYRSGAGEVTVGFGQPTFEMQALLREAGLQVSNENNQYADHIGIELLFASTLCACLAEAESEGGVQPELRSRLADFVNDHPLAWIGSLAEAVRASAPQGYIHALLVLAEALLRMLA